MVANPHAESLPKTRAGSGAAQMTDPANLPPELTISVAAALFATSIDNLKR
jgi:hypothetical protein